MSDRPRQWNSTLPARKSALKRGKPPKARRVPKRFAHRRDPGYCEWIRTHDCILHGLYRTRDGAKPCAGRVECAHVKARGAGGDDVANTVPLCTRHHREQHSIGIQSFQARYAVNLENRALYFGAIQPPKWERDCPKLFPRYPAPDHGETAP